MHRTPIRTLRQKFANDLEDILECPICLNTLGEKIMQCLGGHGICKDCFTALPVKVCPLCKHKYYGTQNFLAQNLAKKFVDIKVSLTDPTNVINQTIVKDKMCIGTQTSPVTQNKAKLDGVSPIANNSNQALNETIITEKVEPQQQQVLRRPMTRLTLKLINQKENQVPHTQNLESTETTEITAKRKVTADPAKPIVTVDPAKRKYPCLIGSCNKLFSHEQMVLHIRDSHMKNFNNAGIVKGNEFATKWKILYKPKSVFNRAIYIHNMGIFFIKIVIDINGDVHGHPVQLGNTKERVKHFKYTLSIGKNDTHVSVESKVLSSLTVSESNEPELVIPSTNTKKNLIDKLKKVGIYIEEKNHSNQLDWYRMINLKERLRF